MVEAQALLFRLDDEVGRLNTAHKNISTATKCDALSRAQRALAKERMEHIEQDKRYRHELRPIEMKEVRVAALTAGLITKIPFPPNFHRDLGIRIIATKSGCGTKEIPLTKMDTGDKARSLSSPFWQSSYAWNQVFGDEGHDGYYINNGNDFKVDGMIIDYYRTIPDIHCPSKVISPEVYIDWNGKSQTDDSGWILDDLADAGIYLAASILTGGIGDANDLQLQAVKALQTDQISKLL